MAARRLLPEAAYDFFVRDSRDGEQFGPFDTYAAAANKCARLRAKMDWWERSALQVTWVINEQKVLLLIKKARST